MLSAQTWRILVFLTFLTFDLKGQALKVKIVGEKLVQTPALRSYQAQFNESAQIQWWVRGAGATINGSSNNVQVSLDLTGRGTDTLIVKATGSAVVCDTIYIRKNTCAAISGVLTPDLRLCRGESDTLTIDGVVGQVFMWQKSSTPNGPWTQTTTTDPFLNDPLQFVTGPLLLDVYYYRALIAAETCRDTSNVCSIKVTIPPFGGLTPLADTICAGDSAVALSAWLSQGFGQWTTDGKGIFSNPTDPNATYHSSPQDSGRIKIAWTISADPCEPLSFVMDLYAIPTAIGKFNQSFSDLCPGDTTTLLLGEVLQGVGQWQTPNGKGIFIFDEQGRARYVSVADDAGQTVRLQWKVENMASRCPPAVYERPLKIRDAKSAKILSPGQDTTVCSGAIIRLAARPVTGYYFWASTAPIEGADSRTPVSKPTSNANYILTVIDFSTNCRSRDTVVIKVENPKLVFSDDSTICAGNSLLLDSGLPGTFVWNPATGLNDDTLATPTATPAETQTYYFQRRYENCLTNGVYRVSVLQTEAPKIEPSFQTENFIGFCQEYDGFLKNTNYNCDKTFWFYTNSSQIQANDVLNPYTGELSRNITLLNDSTLYLNAQAIPFKIGANLPVNTLQIDTMTVSAACWNKKYPCIGYDEITFRILPKPEAKFEALPAAGSAYSDSIPFNNRTVTFRNLTKETEGVFLSYTWDFGDPKSGSANNNQGKNPTHVFSGSGRYNITLVASNGGCSDSETGSLTVLKERYYFPTAFSPNHDGRNEGLRPLPAFWDGSEAQIEAVKVRQIVVYDSWGSVVFETKAPRYYKNAWPGKATNGDLLPTGAYFYQFFIEGADEEHTQELYQGYVNLIR